jgi:hypothetical protein
MLSSPGHRTTGRNKDRRQTLKENIAAPAKASGTLADLTRGERPPNLIVAV